jgi:hypothetical protein
VVEVFTRLHVWPALRCLKELDLSSYKNPGAGAAVQLAAALPSMPCLHTLRLRQVDFVGADVVALLAGMEAPALARLQHLDLSFNKLISDMGYSALADVAGRMTSLRVLDLSGCPASFGAARRLVAAVVDAPQLCSLEEVRVRSSTPEDLSEALEQWQAAPHTARAKLDFVALAHGLMERRDERRWL